MRDILNDYGQKSVLPHFTIGRFNVNDGTKKRSSVYNPANLLSHCLHNRVADELYEA
jgi:hypothetical protein